MEPALRVPVMIAGAKFAGNSGSRVESRGAQPRDGLNRRYGSRYTECSVFERGFTMLVVMKAQATPEEMQAVCEHIEELGFRAHPMPGAQRTAIGITGNQGEVDRGNLEELPGVAEVIRVSKPYKLVSRDVKEEDTVIRFPGTDATIGGAKLAMIAGPCSIETREQAFAIAEQRGGCGRAVLPRRRLQAADFAVCVPGAGRGSAEDHGGDPRPVRSADRDRSDRPRERWSWWTNMRM